MMQIFTTCGRAAVVSDEDYPVLSALRWYAVPKKSSLGGFYFSTWKWVPAKKAGKTIYMHRLIMDAQPGDEVDHINGDPSDNRRENLRIASRSQNCANRRDYRPRSGFRGVQRTQNKRRPWLVCITVGGERREGGRFQTAEAAAHRYDELAKEAFGEFAILNFPSK